MPTRTDAEVLEAIVHILDGETWPPDTLEQIAGVLQAAGYDIRDPEERCAAVSSEGSRCTLDMGHTGRHEDPEAPRIPYWS